MVDKGTLDQCLQRTSFPAHKRVLVKSTSGSGCPSEVIIPLLDLPERTYLSENDVLCQLGDTAYCSRVDVAHSSAWRVPETALGHPAAGAPRRAPDRATRRTTIILLVAALIAAAIIIWLAAAAVIAR